MTTNPYLEGNFGPVAEEQTVTDLPVLGSLPEHLDGRYVRIGPNPIGAPDPATHHWFMGAGMVHGVRLRDGRAEWYRNRWVRSADVAQDLGEAPRPGPVHVGFDLSPNTHVVDHAGRTFALVEGGARPYELTDELETVGPCDFDGTLPGGYTAHPKRDPETGELHAISYFVGWGRRVQYSVLGLDGRIRRTIDIDVGGSPMMHDFSLTERHVVLYDLPVTFDAAKATPPMPRAIRGMARATTAAVLGRRRVPEPILRAMFRSSRRAARRTGQTQTLPYSWDPDRAARIGVMDREGDGSDLRWFDVEPCYVYHPLNAYEEGDHLVLDVVRHPKTFATDHLGPNEGPPTLDRWTVDLAAGKVLEERRDDRPQEFPRVDERRTGRRHRFGYTVGATGSGGESGAPVADGVIRHDLVAGTTSVRSFGAGREAAEMVFVPDGPDAAEEAGVLIGYVYDRSTDLSDLVVLDASTLQTVASVSLPARVPHGFHGSWMPAA